MVTVVSLLTILLLRVSLFLSFANFHKTLCIERANGNGLELFGHKRNTKEIIIVLMMTLEKKQKLLHNLYNQMHF